MNLFYLLPLSAAETLSLPDPSTASLALTAALASSLATSLTAAFPFSSSAART
ncbi:MAG: hypothetical protein JXB10_02305 [Pirellulales bacterium]|nr:hypothetical protein [Pirellulales bacterium]